MLNVLLNSNRYHPIDSPRSQRSLPRKRGSAGGCSLIALVVNTAVDNTSAVVDVAVDYKFLVKVITLYVAGMISLVTLHRASLFGIFHS